MQLLHDTPASPRIKIGNGTAEPAGESLLLSPFGGRISGRIRLVLTDNWRDQTAKAALQQIAEGKVKRGLASLFRVKNNWYFQIPYVTEAVNTGEGFEPDLVMGVAFGLQDALVYAFNTSLKPLRHLYETERNYRNLVNSRYARWVVDIAVKNRCGRSILVDYNAARNLAVYKSEDARL